MKSVVFGCVLAISLAVAAPLAVAAGIPAETLKADDSFHWEVQSVGEVPGGKMTTIRLTSQTWQGLVWKHWLRVIEPAKLRHPDAALLVIAGGRNRDEPPGPLKGEALALALIAAESGSTVALLEQVPNQPLFDNLREDALIAYTFQKFIETRDGTWPALVPMTKSALRAMDALQAWSASRREKGIERFFITGASKRGWTTWLAAAHDKRVFGIAPMVIDVLNMAEQMPHQVVMLGDYSEQIRDYTKLGLPQRIDGPEAKGLLEIVDPYLSRDRLTMPKLIVLGTNDPYWAVDALNLYYCGLPGEKYIHYVPNAGHGLGPSAYDTAAAFYRSMLEGEERPKMAFALEKDAGSGGYTTRVEVGREAVAASAWTSAMPNTDFRRASWAKSEVPVAKGVVSVTTPPPSSGYVASYVEVTFKDARGKEVRLCTPIRVLGANDAAAAAGEPAEVPAASGAGAAGGAGAGAGEGAEGAKPGRELY